MLRPLSADLHIREVEVSITAKCSLACRGCGFLVPDQPRPGHSDIIAEHTEALTRLGRLGVVVDSLAIVGGEPTLRQVDLERAINMFRDLPNVRRIEIVTNGLTPQGVSLTVLRQLDRLSISDYGYQPRLFDLWRKYVSQQNVGVEVVVRTADEGWDQWAESAPVAPEAARRMWETCWYRKHCVTVERGRLFACSRIPKFSRDSEGLALDEATSLADVERYLNGSAALPSCATCTPMIGGEPIPAGVQPDNRIERLQRNAIAWLAERVVVQEEAEKQ